MSKQIPFYKNQWVAMKHHVEYERSIIPALNNVWDRSEHYERVLRAKEEGRPIGWQQLTVFPELFHAFDILNVCPEELPKYAGIYDWEIVCKVLDKSKEFVSDYVCSLNRFMVAAVIEGLVPPPDLIIHASQPCDAGLSTYSAVASYMDIPIFSFDIPYWDDERAVNYVTDQVEECVGFLEDVTGKKLNYDKLREVVEFSIKAQFYRNALYELEKNRPCPIGGKLLHRMQQAWRELCGLPGLVDYFRTIYEFALQNVKEGRGFLRNERIRLAYIYVQHGIFGDLIDWMEDTYQANIVMDYMTCDADKFELPSDLPTPRAIYRFLAKKLLNSPMGMQSRGPARYYFDDIVKKCREFRVDAAIFPGHIGCKQTWALASLLKDILQDELSIPVLIFEYDLCDPRVSTKEEVREKLETFLSTLI